jgi:hypothetical protein
MSNLIKRWFPIVVALFSGIVVLASYLLPGRPPLARLRDTLIQWTVIVAAFAFILGVFNILRVHSSKVLRRRPGRLYSLALVVALLTGMIASGLPDAIPAQASLDRFVFDYTIRPLGASLAALLAFTLTLAAFRLLRARRSVPAVLFFLVVVAVVLGSTPLVGLRWLAGLRDWIINVPGMAGARGLLLGVAIGTIITGLRVFLTIDRPYSES